MQVRHLTRCIFGKRFNLLIDRKLPAIVICLLLDNYTKQNICAIWNGTKSHKFTAMNGVCQGGVLSPLLFNVYVNVLVNILNQKLEDGDDLRKKKSHFIGSVNKMFSKFENVQSAVLLKLFQRYCCRFYGYTLVLVISLNTFTLLMMIFNALWTMKLLYSLKFLLLFLFPLWKLNRVGDNQLCTAWNKAIRKVWRLPPTAHTCMLGPLNGNLHILD